MELLAGCGTRRNKRISITTADWKQLVTMDFNPDHKPDVVHDMQKLPWPFEADTFDEIHCYEVLEHLGQQGDFRAFFAQFSEIWRLLKPGGLLVATSPAPNSEWAWGDPGHTRIISRQSLLFLIQPQYTEQVGVTPMSDYRYWYQADFDVAVSQVNDIKQHVYILQAVKPSRIDPKFKRVTERRIPALYPE